MLSYLDTNIVIYAVWCMHPSLKAFEESFKLWDADGMAHALIELIELVNGAPCSEPTRDTIGWECREYLEAMKESAVSNGFQIAESGLQISLRGSYDWSQEAGRNTSVTLELSVAAAQGTDQHERCTSLGLTRHDVTLDRDEVRLPCPLYGEPGYVFGETQQPSIHRPRGELQAPPHQIYQHALDMLGDGGPMPYWHRYLAGECMQVWAELLALGDGVRGRQVLSDALAVLDETMDRCRSNIATLVERLDAMGYEFQYPEWAYVPPDALVLERLAELEKCVGPLPLSLCGWCEYVGSVNLLGCHPDWPTECQPGSYPDSLLVYPSNALLEYDEEHWYRLRYCLPLAPDYYHKEDVSGGPPYTIQLPSAAIDAPLEYEWHETTFIDYLRQCFRWGGFPGWARVPQTTELERIVRALTKGLQPI